MTTGEFSIFAGILLAFLAIIILLFGDIVHEAGAMFCFILTCAAAGGFIGHGLDIKELSNERLYR